MEIEVGQKWRVTSDKYKWVQVDYYIPERELFFAMGRHNDARWVELRLTREGKFLNMEPGFELTELIRPMKTYWRRKWARYDNRVLTDFEYYDSKQAFDECWQVSLNGWRWSEDWESIEVPE